MSQARSGAERSAIEARTRGIAVLAATATATTDAASRTQAQACPQRGRPQPQGALAIATSIVAAAPPASRDAAGEAARSMPPSPTAKLSARNASNTVWVTSEFRAVRGGRLLQRHPDAFGVRRRPAVGRGHRRPPVEHVVP